MQGRRLPILNLPQHLTNSPLRRTPETLLSKKTPNGHSDISQPAGNALGRPRIQPAKKIVSLIKAELPTFCQPKIRDYRVREVPRRETGHQKAIPEVAIGARRYTRNKTQNPVGLTPPCGFDSHLRHQNLPVKSRFLELRLHPSPALDSCLFFARTSVHQREPAIHPRCKSRSVCSQRCPS